MVRQDNPKRPQDKPGADSEHERQARQDHDERERAVRPSGPDEDYRGAGYAGPGGYGGGFGGEQPDAGKKENKPAPRKPRNGDR
jgi:hypothetical protein